MRLLDKMTQNWKCSGSIKKYLVWQERKGLDGKKSCSVSSVIASMSLLGFTESIFCLIE